MMGARGIVSGEQMTGNKGKTSFILLIHSYILIKFGCREVEGGQNNALLNCCTGLKSNKQSKTGKEVLVLRNL